MTHRKWTTQPQVEWLKSHCDSFATTEANNTRNEFFQGVIAKWLELWPNPEPSSDDVAQNGGTEQAVHALYNFQVKVDMTLSHRSKYLPVWIIAH